MRGCDVNAVYVWIGDELSIGAVGLCVGWTIDLGDEVLSTGCRGRRCYGDDLMGDIMDITGCWVGEDVLGEGWAALVRRCGDGGVILTLRDSTSCEDTPLHDEWRRRHDYDVGLIIWLTLD